MESPVNVYTEWAPLQEVIVGDCLNFNIDLLDPTFEFVYYENLKSQKHRKTKQYKIDRKRLEQRAADLNRLQKVLEEFGVIVRRPKSLDKAISIKTPHFNAICMAPDSPRDTVACVGQTIIETPPIVRGRYFENMHYREIFLDYFKKGATWVSAPNPMLTKETIDMIDLNETWIDVPADKFHGMKFINPKYEIAFDAANFVKLGTDILFNIGSQNHELGCHWLQSILGNDFDVWPIRLCDSHIDGAIALLAPGKILYNPALDKKRKILEQLPKQMKKWDMIPTEEEDLSFCLDDEEIALASEEGMFMNVLSINQDTVLVQDTAVNTIKSLERHKFEVVPIEFNQGRLFSGGLHCCTVDVRREEDQERYL